MIIPRCDIDGVGEEESAQVVAGPPGEVPLCILRGGWNFGTTINSCTFSAVVIKVLKILGGAEILTQNTLPRDALSWTPGGRGKAREAPLPPRHCASRSSVEEALCRQVLGDGCQGPERLGSCVHRHTAVRRLCSRINSRKVKRPANAHAQCSVLHTSATPSS